MNLLFCQKGLCAYTEVQLCPQNAIEISNWENGKYKFTYRANDGQLEHFDEKLKSKDKDKTGIKDWLWSNFFMIDSDTNRRKGIKEVNYILKPDSDDYDEFTLLDYDIESHRFTANSSLPKEKKEIINNMINNVLGINFPNLIDKRRKTIIQAIEFGTDIIETQFPTAFEFYRRRNKITIL